MENMVIMGRVVAPYGVLGWLKIHPDTEMLDGLLDYPTWWLGRAPHWVSRAVEAAKVHNAFLLVKLEGVNDRDAAFACKGMSVAVPREALPEPQENEFYWSDLIGLQVTNLQGVDFGHVQRVFETGANDVVVVKKDKKERLLPFVDQVIKEVNLKQGVLVVDWLEAWDAED